jgi:hypothetical protein
MCFDGPVGSIKSHEVEGPSKHMRFLGPSKHISLEKDSVHSGISLQKGAFIGHYGFISIQVSMECS